MIIDNNILAISNVIFRDREKWQYITDEQKSEFAFIFNRFFSKKFPHHALCLNLKKQDKVTIMDMWFHFMKDKPYPNWFWSKSEKWSKTSLDDKDFKFLMKKMNLNKEDDLVYLMNYYSEIIEEELKYYKKKEKNASK